jgi:hypothetical protein
VAIVTAAADGSGRAIVLTRRVTRAVAVIAAAGLIAFLGFLAGEHHQRPVTVLTGIATVGDQLATVTVAGWSYAIQGTSTPWVDQQGMTHYGSWPACLGGPGRAVPVTFAEVPVPTPDDSTTRQVVWVDCNP